MIFVYRVISIIIFPILVIFIYFRKFINKEDPVRYKEKIFLSSFINNFSDKRKLIWFHVASVGELQSIIPIIQSLNKLLFVLGWCAGLLVLDFDLFILIV